MAHLSKQLRVMKRLLTIAACLTCLVSAQAQSYKPLEKVEVPDEWANKVYISKQESFFSGTYYIASHHIGQRYMTANLKTPAYCTLAVLREDSPVTQSVTACFSVGGTRYYLKVALVSDKSICFDLQEDHIRHIAVSGIQSITYMNNGEPIHAEEYNLIEQELWRRTAEELGKAAYIIY